jgi:hypothetical protein
MPRYLSRTDVPPLRQDVPIDAIAQLLARKIEETGHLTHEDALLEILLGFSSKSHLVYYWEPVRDRRGKVIEKRRLLHPEILRALKKLTGKNIIWGKECREWWAKGVGEAARQAMMLRRYPLPKRAARRLEGWAKPRGKR